MPSEEIIKNILSFLAGATMSAIFTFKWTKSTISKQFASSQANNKVTGDMAGRDIRK